MFDKLASGDIKPTDEYVVSEHAWRHGGAPSGGPTMFAAIHSRVAVQDLLRGLVILNANDGAIALGEGVSGNERAFTELMTKRAREIGLSDATFANASGLPDLANQMSVREIAKLARFIIKTYPEQYKLFNERDFTWNKIHQTNRNPLLNSLTSADGLKTGFSKDGGYGMVGSAVQNGMPPDRCHQWRRRSRRPPHRSQEDAGVGVPQFRGAGTCSKPARSSATPRCSAA